MFLLESNTCFSGSTLREHETCCIHCRRNTRSTPPVASAVNEPRVSFPLKEDDETHISLMMRGMNRLDSGSIPFPFHSIHTLINIIGRENLIVITNKCWLDLFIYYYYFQQNRISFCLRTKPLLRTSPAAAAGVWDAVSCVSWADESNSKRMSTQKEYKVMENRVPSFFCWKKCLPETPESVGQLKGILSFCLHICLMIVILIINRCIYILLRMLEFRIFFRAHFTLGLGFLCEHSWLQFFLSFTSGPV